MNKTYVFRGVTACLVIWILAGLLVACSGGSAYLPPVGTRLYHKGEKAYFSTVTAEDLTHMALGKQDWAGMTKVILHARRTEATGDSPVAYFDPKVLEKPPAANAVKTATSSVPTAVVAISDQGPKAMGSLNFLEWLVKLVTDYWILLVISAATVLAGMMVYWWEGNTSGPRSIDIKLTNAYAQSIPVEAIELMVTVVWASEADERSWINTLGGKTEEENIAEALKQIRQAVEGAALQLVVVTSIFDLAACVARWCSTKEGLDWPQVGLRLKSIRWSGQILSAEVKKLMQIVQEAKQHGGAALAYYRELAGNPNASPDNPNDVANAYAQLKMATNQNGNQLITRPDDYRIGGEQ